MAAIKLSLLAQNPEGYARGFDALGNLTERLEIEDADVETLIVTGDEDRVGPPVLCVGMIAMQKRVDVAILKETDHWHCFENPVGVAEAVVGFLGVFCGLNRQRR
jgi:pimeloyl-ACP methyl ester carboxylesterase